MRAFEEGEIVGVVRGEQRRRAEVADGLPVGEGFDDRARALDFFGIGHPVAIMQFARWRVGGLAIVEETLHLFASPSIHASSVRSLCPPTISAMPLATSSGPSLKRC